MISVFKAVFFDIDGTLVDSNEQHVNAWAFAFREAGCSQEIEDIRRQIGKVGDLIIPTLAPELGQDARSGVADAHGRHFKESYLANVRAFDRATDLVQRTHDSGRQVVLASSAQRSELDHYVGLLGIADLVDASTSIDDVETSKPEPDIFSAALEKVGLAPSEVVVIGDTIYDIEAAARSGIVAIGLLSGAYNETELRDAGAIAVYADVAALLADIGYSPIRAGR